jgi:hypothetical protein
LDEETPDGTDHPDLPDGDGLGDHKGRPYIGSDAFQAGICAGFTATPNIAVKPAQRSECRELCAS